MLLNLATSSPAPAAAAANKSLSKKERKKRALANRKKQKQQRGSDKGVKNKPHQGGRNTKQRHENGNMTRGTESKERKPAKPKRNIKVVTSKTKASERTTKAASASGAEGPAQENELSFLEQMAQMSKKIDSELEPLIASTAGGEGDLNGNESDTDYDRTTSIAARTEKPMAGSSRETNVGKVFRKSASTAPMAVRPGESVQSKKLTKSKSRDVDVDVDVVKVPQSTLANKPNRAAAFAKAAAAAAAESRAFGSRKHPKKADARDRTQYRPKAKVAYEVITNGLGAALLSCVVTPF